MKLHTNAQCGGFDNAFYGSATVGERGQIVIPAEARAEMGIEPGDKVLIMRHPIHDGLQVFKLSSVREFLDEYAQKLNQIAELPDTEEDHGA